MNTKETPEGKRKGKHTTVVDTSSSRLKVFRILELRIYVLSFAT